MASSHTLQFSHYSIPVRFNMLGMYTSGGINEVKGMIYNFMVECWKPFKYCINLSIYCIIILQLIGIYRYSLSDSGTAKCREIRVNVTRSTFDPARTEPKIENRVPYPEREGPCFRSSSENLQWAWRTSHMLVQLNLVLVGESLSDGSLEEREGIVQCPQE